MLLDGEYESTSYFWTSDDEMAMPFLTYDAPEGRESESMPYTKEEDSPMARLWAEIRSGKPDSSKYTVILSPFFISNQWVI